MTMPTRTHRTCVKNPVVGTPASEVDEKLRDRNGARAAYEKCVEVASDAKMVAEAKRKLEKLPQK